MHQYSYVTTKSLWYWFKDNREFICHIHDIKLRVLTSFFNKKYKVNITSFALNIAIFTCLLNASFMLRNNHLALFEYKLIGDVAITNYYSEGNNTAHKPANRNADHLRQNFPKDIGGAISTPSRFSSNNLLVTR